MDFSQAFFDSVTYKLKMSISGIFGVCSTRNPDSGKEEHFLLVIDPHFWKNSGASPEKILERLTEENWIQWKNLDEFLTGSFYNLCLPQITAKGP